MLLNCGVGEDCWESLGLQGNPTSPSIGDQSWVFIWRTDVETETLILWLLEKKSWLFEKTLMLGKIEGRRRRWQQRMRWLDGIIYSMTWVWINSRSWWWKGRPAMLWSMGLWRVRHDRVTDLNWCTIHNELEIIIEKKISFINNNDSTVPRIKSYSKCSRKFIQKTTKKLFWRLWKKIWKKSYIPCLWME